MTKIYVSEADVAAMLDRSVDWLRANRETLERDHGFPKIDPAVGKRHAPSIERWAEERNRPRPHMTGAGPERIGRHEHF